jgi:hypothetical protein
LQVKKSSKKGGRKMTEKEYILKLFTEDHLKQKEIALIIKKSEQHVSDVLKNETKAIEEKANRKRESKEKKKAYNRKYNETYVRKSKSKSDEEREEYEKLLADIDKDNEKLSTKKEMSDLAFAEWNRSAYGYSNNSSGLELKKEINATCDVPKKVENIVNASSIKGNTVYGIGA